MVGIAPVQRIWGHKNNTVQDDFLAPLLLKLQTSLQIWFRNSVEIWLGLPQGVNVAKKGVNIAKTAISKMQQR